MKSKSADKIKMPSIDELLGVSGEESATDIEISRIHSFAKHAYYKVAAAPPYELLPALIYLPSTTPPIGTFIINS